MGIRKYDVLFRLVPLIGFSIRTFAAGYAIRISRFAGLREDKNPREVVNEGER